MANDSINQVSNLEYPRTPKQLRSALGETNFMRDYIPDYSNIVKPLTSIVNGTAKDLRSVAAMQAWKTLMNAVRAQASLCHLDYKKEIIVRVDASIRGIGAVLINRWVDPITKQVLHRGRSEVENYRTRGVRNGLCFEALVPVAIRPYFCVGR